MRDHGGRFDFNLTQEERVHYGAISARVDLERILTAEFGGDGHPIGVTQEEMQWALSVVQERPSWAIQILSNLGFKDASDFDGSGKV